VHPAESQPGILAERLLRLRRDAGLTGEQLAQTLGWGEKTGRPKVSKIENGRQVPSDDDIRAWAQATGHPELTDDLLELRADMLTTHTRWRRQMRAGGAAIQQERGQRTQAATRIREFETVLVPALLQTSGYARSIYVRGKALYEMPDVDASVQARMQNQQALYDPSKTFEFIFTEAALLLLPCSPQVMLGQLDRLLSLGMENVTLGIIPFGVELPMVPASSFMLLDDNLTVETLTGKTEENAGEEAEISSRIFDMLMTGARTGDEARQLIMSAAEQLRGNRQ
jgi:transcriptional regulator with XRE-family HTH domain